MTSPARDFYPALASGLALSLSLFCFDARADDDLCAVKCSYTMVNESQMHQAFKTNPQFRSGPCAVALREALEENAGAFMSGSFFSRFRLTQEKIGRFYKIQGDGELVDRTGRTIDSGTFFECMTESDILSQGVHGPS